MNGGKIFYSKKDQNYFIKLTGNLRFTNARNFENLLDAIFKDFDIKDIMIDLTEANYIDSTMLGLLAKIANFIIKKFQRKVTILSINKNINYLLENIGLDNVFIIIDKSDYTQKTLQKIPNIKSSERENALTILNAHRQLIKLNEKNKTVFKDIVKLLEEEIK